MRALIGTGETAWACDRVQRMSTGQSPWPIDPRARPLSTLCRQMILPPGLRLTSQDVSRMLTARPAQPLQTLGPRAKQPYRRAPISQARTATSSCVAWRSVPGLRARRHDGTGERRRRFRAIRRKNQSTQGGRAGLTFVPV